MKHIALSIAGFIALAPLHAEQTAPDRTQLAVQLLDEMDFCGMLERNFDEMKAAQVKQARKMSQYTGQDAAADIDRTYELILEVMNCDMIKEETAVIYADLFTEAELRGLIDFYQSELGKSFNRKQPEMMRRTMEVSMKRLNEAMPRIMNQVQQERAEKVEAGRPVATPAE